MKKAFRKLRTKSGTICNNLMQLACYKKLFLLVYTIISLLMPTVVQAGVFDTCVYSWEFGDTTRVKMLVYPIGAGCYKQCYENCAIYARAGINGSLNDDIVDRCRSSCQKGTVFSSQYREATLIPKANSLEPFVWRDEIKMEKVCSTVVTNKNSAAYNYYDSGVVLSSASPASIKMVIRTGSTFGNQVYLCGFGSANIYPNFYAVDQKAWQDNQQVWNVSHNSVEQISAWNARNYAWTDTTIKPRDGDRIAINYGGPYMYKCEPGPCSAQGNCQPPVCEFNQEADNLQVARGYNGMLTGSPITLPGGDLITMLQPDCPSTMSDNDRTICLANAAEQQSLTPGQIGTHNSAIEVLGLKGWASNGVTLSGVALLPGQASYKVASFGGILEGFSGMPSSLLIRHYDVGDSSAWMDNVGGKYVQIQWRGCPYEDGERLQYAVVPPDAGSTAESATYTPDANAQWLDVPKNVLQGATQLDIDDNAEGKLYFRIQPLGSFTDNIGDDATQAIGQYYFELSVDKQAQGRLMGVIDQMIQKIASYFFGPDGKSGIVQTIFNDLIADSVLIKAIRALLILYVAFTGLSFMVGVAQFTQQEALIRIVKIGVVLLLISGNGWQFFNTYLFPLFTQGMLDLIYLTYSDPILDPTAAAQIKQGNMYAVFYNLDRPVGQMLFGASGTGIYGTGLFGSVAWKKVEALCLTSVFGPFLGAVVVVGCVFYIMAIFKAVMVFLLSLIGIAIMIMTAPLFISLILFAKTREMFDAWIKLFMSFSFQPVMVFAMLGILGKLVLAMFYLSLWFTVCEACFFKISMPIFGVDKCIYSAYVTMISAFSGGGYFSSPISSAAVAIAFLLIAIATYSMIDVMCSLATQIISGAYYGVHLGGIAAAANPFTKLVDAWEGALGSHQGQDPTDRFGRLVAKRRGALVKAAHKAESKGRGNEQMKDWDAVIKYGKARDDRHKAETTKESAEEKVRGDRDRRVNKQQAEREGRQSAFNERLDKMSENVRKEVDKEFERQRPGGAMTTTDEIRFNQRREEAFQARNNEMRARETQQWQAEERATQSREAQKEASTQRQEVKYLEKLEGKVEEARQAETERREAYDDRRASAGGAAPDSSRSAQDAAREQAEVAQGLDAQEAERRRRARNNNNTGQNS